MDFTCSTFCSFTEILLIVCPNRVVRMIDCSLAVRDSRIRCYAPAAFLNLLGVCTDFRGVCGLDTCVCALADDLHRQHKIMCIESLTCGR